MGDRRRIDRELFSVTNETPRYSGRDIRAAIFGRRLHTITDARRAV
jgi:hypothetical protein